MVKAWLSVVLCTAAFGDTITYNYTGTLFTRCSDNCPANFSSDYNTASFTFSAPLAGNLSSANELSSPNLTAWTITDAHGTAAYSSTDANAATELTILSLSTDGSGAILGWGIQGPIFAPGSGIAYFGMVNPTVIGKGSGLPEADAFVNTASNGYALGNSIPGSWTETLNLFQGGPSSAPVFLLGGSPVGEVTGTISGPGAQEYYLFNWAGGAFSATASITGASDTASYLFTEGPAGSCMGGASQPLNIGNTFMNTIAANLGPGQYCIGIDTLSGVDPGYTLDFKTPVSGVPEPSSFIWLCAALGMIGVLGHAKRGRQHS